MKNPDLLSALNLPKKGDQATTRDDNEDGETSGKAGASAEPNEVSPRKPSQARLKKGRDNLQALVAEISSEKQKRRRAITFHVFEEIDDELTELARSAGISKSKVLERIVLAAMGQ